jgi:Flp pilus assembly protein TadG
MKTHRHRQRGNALLESALTLGLFVIVLFSLFDFGWVLFLHQTIVNQARAAARYGAVNPADTSAIQNMVVYSKTSGGRGRGVAGIIPANVAVSRNGATGGSDDRIVIRVSGYRYTVVTPGWAGSFPGKDIVVTMPVEN